MTHAHSRSPRRLFGALGIMASLALAGAACSSSGASTAASLEPPSDLSTVLTVNVHNDQLEEARTWLWVEGQRFRLGSVRANTSETFYYPVPGIRRMHLEFDVTLGQHCVTTDRSLGPGDEIDARIPSTLVAFEGVCRPR